MDVRLPNGTVLRGVPDGTTKEEIMRKAISGGYATPDDFGAPDPSWQEDKPPMSKDEFYSMMQGYQQRNSQPATMSDDTLADNALDVAGEFAAGANRAVTGLVDMVPNAVNAGLSLAGSDRRVPTLTGALEPYGIQGGFMEPGRARQAVQAAGGAAVAAGGLVPVARPAAAASSLASDFLGIGATKASPAVVNTASNALGLPTSSQDVLAAARSQRPPKPVRTTLDQDLALKRRTGDAETLGMRLDETGVAVRDRAQEQAQKQGFQDSVITMVRDSSPKTKERFRQMVNIIDRSKSNATFEAMNRPGDVIGDSIALRTRAIAAANRVAGQKVGEVAQELRNSGQTVDVSGAMQRFEADLAEMGITRSATDTNFRFEASDIDGLQGATNTLNGLLDQLRKRDGTNPYAVHQMKRWIDEQVSWGKAGEGLSGKTERVLKSLRRNLDQALDEQFPEYNRANTMYSETIQALDSLQEAAGKRIDLTGQDAETALGTLSRRILGNPVSRQQLMRGLRDVDEVAQKVLKGEYAGTGLTPYRPDIVSNISGVTLDDLDDGIVQQVRFVTQLEEMFGTNAKNSFLGEELKAADRMAESAMVGDKTGPIRETFRYLNNKRRGINEENAMKALRDLLQ